MRIALAVQALVSVSCADIFAIALVTYSKPVLKMARSPSLAFFLTFRCHTVIIGKSKIAKSEQVLITALESCIAV